METKTNIITRYSETDQMGIIHHSNYAVWFEAGRTDFFKKLGTSYKEIENKGILLPLYGMNCRFISPARYEDEVVIKTTLKAVTKIRVIFSYVVVNLSDGKILADGETMHAWTNKLLKPVNAAKAIPDIYFLLMKYGSDINQN